MDCFFYGDFMKEEYNLIHILYLASIILFFVSFLSAFFMDSTFGYSLYAGFCCFITIIFFNKKAFKKEKPKERY